MHVDNEHKHEHSHEHNHAHNHGHSSGSEAPGASAKDIAILKYMLEHNRQHARELSEIGVRLAGAGLDTESGLISDAVHYFDHANDSLEKAVGLITGGGE